MTPQQSQKHVAEVECGSSLSHHPAFAALCLILFAMYFFSLKSIVKLTFDIYKFRVVNFETKYI